MVSLRYGFLEKEPNHRTESENSPVRVSTPRYKELRTRYMGSFLCALPSKEEGRLLDDGLAPHELLHTAKVRVRFRRVWVRVSVSVRVRVRFSAPGELLHGEACDREHG